MKNFIVLSLGLLFFFNACNTSNENKQHLCQDSDKHGIVRIGILQPYQTLFPISINDIFSSQLVSLFHEGLVSIDPVTSAITPAIASRWDINKEETEYRFYLRKNAFFHDYDCFPKNKGRAITANDVIFSFQLMCSKRPDNYASNIFLEYVKGAKEFYEGQSQQIEGIRIENDTTIVISLLKPNLVFLHFLASPSASIIAKEAYDKYNTSLTVGTGPFILHSFNENNKPMIFTKNPNYFKTDNENKCLPYLDSVYIYFVPLKQQLDMLLNNQLDIVTGIDNETLTSFLEQNIQLFEGDKAKFVVIQDKNDVQRHIILRKNIKNFFINTTGLFSLTETYVEKDSIQ